MIYFGPAGNCEDFYNSGRKASAQIPEWLSMNSLNAYEYQCGNGVRVTAKTAAEIGEQASKFGVKLSVHSPYFISLSSVEKEKRVKSVDYILQTMTAAKAMGADRVVVHSGSCAKISREEALHLAKDTLRMAISACDDNGFGNISICPETMGKINQLGTVEEVMEMCLIDERLIPTIDFGHINARTLGGLKTKEDFEYIIDLIHNKLGEYRGKHFHVHFSRIEFTSGGEKKHHTLADTDYGPDFNPLAQIIAERDLCPHIICESAGTQTKDSVEMMNMYKSYLR